MLNGTKGKVDDLADESWQVHISIVSREWQL